VSASGARAGCPIAQRLHRHAGVYAGQRPPRGSPAAAAGAAVQPSAAGHWPGGELVYRLRGAHGAGYRGLCGKRPPAVCAGRPCRGAARRSRSQTEGRARAVPHPSRQRLCAGACRLSGAALPAPGHGKHSGRRVRCGQDQPCAGCVRPAYPGRCLCAGHPAAAPRHRALPYRRERPQQGAASPRRGHGGRP